MANDLSIPDKYKGKTIWSFSKLSGFEGCKYAYYLQRIKKVKSKQNIWGLLGSVTHDVIEKLMKDEIDIKEAISSFVNEIEEGKILGITFPTQSMEDNYVKSIIHYLERFKKPDIKDFKIELKEFLEVDDKNVLIGFLDFTIQHMDGSIEIRDFKTSSKFSKKDLKEKAKQLIIYSEMLKQRYNKIKEVRVSFDMLKYCVVHFNKGRPKTCERHKLVALLKDKIKVFLLEHYDELEAEEVLLNAIIKNEIPEIVSDNFKIEPYILYYDYTEEEIKELYDWINLTIGSINNMVDYPAKIETDPKSEFWCTNLCGVSEHCDAYKEFLENKNKDKVVLDGDDLF